MHMQKIQNIGIKENFCSSQVVVISWEVTDNDVPFNLVKNHRPCPPQTSPDLRDRVLYPSDSVGCWFESSRAHRESLQGFPWKVVYFCKNKQPSRENLGGFLGVPDWIRTSSLQSRRDTALYLVDLAKFVVGKVGGFSPD